MRIPGRSSADEGFSFIETLACSFAMALVIGALAPLVDGLLKALDRLAKQERQVYRITLAYDVFRSACDRTCPPPWACAGTLLERNDHEWTIHYINSEIVDSWSLIIDDTGIRIHTKDTTIAFEADSAELTAIVFRNKIIGLTLSFHAVDSDWHWQEYFGAHGT